MLCSSIITSKKKKFHNVFASFSEFQKKNPYKLLNVIPQIIFNAIKEYNLTLIINQIHVGYKKYQQVLNPGLNGTSAKKCPI